jgi:magnesium-transporting ATPase (P-type)
MGIRTVMVTGDNELTAAAIAAESGVDDYLSQATPEDKLEYIRKEQSDGKMVAMCGAEQMTLLHWRSQMLVLQWRQEQLLPVKREIWLI